MDVVPRSLVRQIVIADDIRRHTFFPYCKTFPPFPLPTIYYYPPESSPEPSDGPQGWQCFSFGKALGNTAGIVAMIADGRLLRHARLSFTVIIVVVV
jgi:hypothetical protein